jgi:hypothetical protein
MIAATETDLAFIKRIGWCLAIYATTLKNLLQVYTQRVGFAGCPSQIPHPIR